MERDVSCLTMFLGFLSLWLLYIYDMKSVKPTPYLLYREIIMDIKQTHI